MDNRMEWDTDASILTNRFILLEVGRALPIAFLFAAVITSMIILPSLMDGSIFSVGIGTSGPGIPMFMIGLLFLLTVVFIFFYYGNKYLLYCVVMGKRPHGYPESAEVQKPHGQYYVDPDGTAKLQSRCSKRRHDGGGRTGPEYQVE